MNVQARLIFEEVIDLEAGEREARLARACAGDEVLRREVESLISSFEKADGFLSEPSISTQRLAAGHAGATRLGGEGGAFAAVFEQPGDVIGRYRLVEEIGSGGFGVVFRAEQTEPVKRPVALKIIKVGMDTRERMARFDAERQALAMMDHPNIAKVLDAGSTSTGRLYFVMELVEGTSITQFCEQRRLGVAERLRLFRQVCSAVQHAHQKGIIHRDIKPSNVLVTTVDGEPAPKVIDFGIAKAIDVKLTERTLLTQSHQVIGTPDYMSPEQAGSATNDIDTRTDVYSLGVLLYEMLTGLRPFDFSHMKTITFEEMQRMIREVDPVKPSLRLSQDVRVASAGAAPAAPATTRATSSSRTTRASTRKLETTLRGDLDWIVMKCLEKDRGRRYATAQSLSEDVQRYLASEPVVAGPPSVGYRAAKFYKRHRAGVLASGAFAVLLVAGVGALAAMYVRVLQERSDSETSQSAVQRATANLGLALFGSFNSRQGELGRELIVGNLTRLQADADAIDWRRLPQPEYEIRKTLAVGYECLLEGERGSGQIEGLVAVAERLEPPRSRQAVIREVAEELHRQAGPRLDAGDSARAMALLDRAAVLLEGNSDEGTVLLEKVRVSRAAILSERGEFAAARRILERAVAVLGDGARVADTGALAEAQYNLAAVLRILGESKQAIALVDQSLQLTTQVNPEGHISAVKCLALRGLIHLEDGEGAQAKEYFERAEALAEAWPDDSVDRRHLVQTYATLAYDRLRARSGSAKLESRLATSVTIALAYAPDGNPAIVQGLTVLMSIRRQAGDNPGAATWAAKAHALSASHSEWPPEVTRRSLMNLAALKRDLGDYQGWVELLREQVRLERTVNAGGLAQSEARLAEAERRWRFKNLYESYRLHRALRPFPC